MCLKSEKHDTYKPDSQSAEDSNAQKLRASLEFFNSLIVYDSTPTKILIQKIQIRQCDINV